MEENKNWQDYKAVGFFKKVFTDKEYMKDLKTITVFLFAYFIAFITNGFINDFEREVLLSFAVGLGTVGIYIAITTVTEEGAQRGNQDAEDTDKELQTLLKEKRDYSKKINRSVVVDILQEYNKQRIKEAKQEAYDKKRQKLERRIEETKARIEILEELGIKWSQVIRKIKRWRFKRQITRTKNQITKLNPLTTPIRFEPLEVDDFVREIPEMNKGVNEKKRLRETPVTRTRRKMGRMNFVKTLFFYGFQGAVFVSIGSYMALLWFFILITLTLLSTLFMSYASTKKYAETDYKQDISDAINKIKWLLEEQNKRKPLEKTEATS
jgi:hypothetical protein